MASLHRPVSRHNGKGQQWKKLFLVVNDFCYLTSLFKLSQAIFSSYVYLFKDIIQNSHITLIIMTLLFPAFDIEQNPDPSHTQVDLSTLHLNIRSIRNKTDFIKDNFLDFNILCFSESHLDMPISNDQLFLTDTFDQPYRRDRTNHGGELLVYLNSDLAHVRRPGLDDMSLAWPAVVLLLVFIYSGIQ